MRLAEALVRKDVRKENIARLELIDSYLTGNYVHQAKEHCHKLLSLQDSNRFKAEAAMRRAEIAKSENLPLEDAWPQIYAEFFGKDERYRKLV